ncbi:glycosyltransferase [Candidatus Micrarchaeota archaeon]|nr:glycosyltransferase [Candidatus Micrarchaeota archaeon]
MFSTKINESDGLSEISVIIPIYNEEGILLNNVSRVKDALENLGMDYEIILAEDGSTDESPFIVKRLVSEKMRIMSSGKKLGRGATLNRAIRSAKGNIVIYMDADLATDLKHTKDLIKEIRKGADICTGSRFLPGSKVGGRKALREFLSRGYNMMLRTMFDTSVKDHQCGFKAFRRAAVLPLLEEMENNHWFWDSELLIRARLKGLTITEIPVEWKDRKESGVRLRTDILEMGAAALFLRFRI